MSYPITSKRTAGFTVTEILVVVAIIILLSALLLPVFARVREDNRRATCTNNLKQIYSGLQQYIQDHDAAYPKEINWIQAIHPYIKSEDIFDCPSQTTVNPLNDYMFNSLRLNTFVKGILRSNHGLNESSLVSVTNTIVIQDTWGFDWPSGKVNLPSSCNLTLHGHPLDAMGGSIVHSGKGNYLFADGHVKALSPEAAVELECAAGLFTPGNS
jgi:prepilin-type processing-associated H-X9-DG protein